ncbi:hypothetical protein KEM55_003452, partial [Ascosphaera atra]
MPSNTSPIVDAQVQSPEITNSPHDKWTSVGRLRRALGAGTARLKTSLSTLSVVNATSYAGMTRTSSPMTAQGHHPYYHHLHHHDEHPREENVAPDEQQDEIARSMLIDASNTRDYDYFNGHDDSDGFYFYDNSSDFQDTASYAGYTPYATSVVSPPSALSSLDHVTRGRGSDRRSSSAHEGPRATPRSVSRTPWSRIHSRKKKKPEPGSSYYEQLAQRQDEYLDRKELEEDMAEMQSYLASQNGNRRPESDLSTHPYGWLWNRPGNDTSVDASAIEDENVDSPAHAPSPAPAIAASVQPPPAEAKSKRRWTARFLPKRKRERKAAYEKASCETQPEGAQAQVQTVGEVREQTIELPQSLGMDDPGETTPTARNPTGVSVGSAIKEREVGTVGIGDDDLRKDDEKGQNQNEAQTGEPWKVFGMGKRPASRRLGPVGLHEFYFDDIAVECRFALASHHVPRAKKAGTVLNAIADTT